MTFEETPEYKMGDAAQKQWAIRLTGYGRIVLPAYGAKEVSSLTKAPVLFAPNGLMIVSPDLLVMGGGRPTVWNEVKAKTIPSWRRCRPGPRYEHGIDYGLIKEYTDIQTKTAHAVWLIVHEKESPTIETMESPCVPKNLWLAISLDEALKVGDLRRDWPQRNGERSRKRLGGWLWPRSAMKPMGVAK